MTGTPRRGGPYKPLDIKLRTISVAVKPQHYEMLLAQAVLRDQSMGQVLRSILDTWMSCFQAVSEGDVAQ
jgi:hypothetical protein